jgi:hypothetical protein
MLSDISGTSKTVQTEAIRLFKMIIRLETDGTITPERATELRNRITALLGCFTDDLDVLLQYETIEAAICCGKCHGTGIDTFVNGADAGDCFMAMETIRRVCPVCGG